MMLHSPCAPVGADPRVCPGHTTPPRPLPPGRPQGAAPTSAAVDIAEKHTRGSGLLTALILLLAAASAALAAAGHLHHQAKRQADARSVAALIDAKTALLGYAVGYPERHPGQGIGYLPCPDPANTGSSPGASCHVRDHGALGRFPFRTLGLPVLRDGHGQCLWYAVAGSFKNNPKALTLNWDSPGQFRIADPDGRAISGEDFNVVAAILAPMSPLPGQTRPAAADTAGARRCPGSTSAADDLPAFLDRAYGVDLVGDITLVHGRPGSDANDIAAWLTVDEVFDALRRRPDFPALLDTVLDSATMALQARLGEPAFLAAHADTAAGNRVHGRLPDAAGLGVATEQADVYDNWRDQLRFVACSDGSACLTATLIDSAISPPIAETETCRALVLFGGERLRGAHPQRRRTDAERADPAQYLEGTNLAGFASGMGDYAGYRHYAPADPHQPASEDLIRCIP